MDGVYCVQMIDALGHWSMMSANAAGNQMAPLCAE